MISVIVITHPGYEQFLPKTLESIRKQGVEHEIIIEDNTRYTLAKACNNAIERSRGEYIIRVDSDDWIANSLLKAESEYLELHPELDCVWCDYWKSFDDHSEYYANPVLEHACGAMFRKSTWEKLGGYDESLHYQEAFEFWLNFQSMGLSAHRIEKPLYYYRQHNVSMSRNINEKLATRKRILEKYALDQRNPRGTEKTRLRTAIE